MSEFERALNAYAFHIRHEIGYPATDATLMIIGFAAGWEAHKGGGFERALNAADGAKP